MTDQAIDAVQPAQASTEPAALVADTSNQSINQPITPQAPQVQTISSVTSSQTAPEIKGSGSSILPKDIGSALELTDEVKQKIAGGDDKVLKELNKYKNLGEFTKSKLALQEQFSKTRPVPQLPKDATPEQIKEYREAAGIPESWEKYDTTLDKGLTIGEIDKPIVNEYLKAFHDANLKPDEVKKVLQIHFEKQNQLAAESIKKADEYEAQTKTVLIEQLGPKYDERMTMVSSFIKTALGEEVFNKLNGAIAPDGTYLISDPKFLNYFLEASKNQYGNPTPAPTKGAEMTGLLSRKAELEKISSTNPKQWYDSGELREEYNNILSTLARK